MTRYAILRTAGVGLLTPLVLLAGSSAALAATVVRDDGDEPGAPMSWIEWLFWFVGAPVALFALITLVVLLPEMRRRRYGPGLGAPAEPVWLGPGGHGARTPVASLPAGGAGGDPAAAADALRRPIAVESEDADLPLREARAQVQGADPTEATLSGGGASARW